LAVLVDFSRPHIIVAEADVFANVHNKGKGALNPA